MSGLFYLSAAARHICRQMPDRNPPTRIPAGWKGPRFCSGLYFGGFIVQPYDFIPSLLPSRCFAGWVMNSVSVDWQAGLTWRNPQNTQKTMDCSQSYEARRRRSAALSHTEIQCTYSILCIDSIKVPCPVLCAYIYMCVCARHAVCTCAYKRAWECTVRSMWVLGWERKESECICVCVWPTSDRDHAHNKVLLQKGFSPLWLIDS